MKSFCFCFQKEALFFFEKKNQKTFPSFVDAGCRMTSDAMESDMISTAISSIDPTTALGVIAATAATDAVYVMFTSAVVARRRVHAASWSSVWYLLSSFAVISYTENWVYVVFAAIGSWIGAFASITFLHRPGGKPPVGASPD